MAETKCRQTASPKGLFRECHRVVVRRAVVSQVGMRASKGCHHDGGLAASDARGRIVESPYVPSVPCWSLT